MAISFVGAGALSAAITSPLSVALPTHSEGDFLMLVVVDRTGVDGFENISVPAGWEGPIAAGKLWTNQEGIRVFWKIAEASETDPISVSTTGNITLGWGAVIFAYSGVDASDPLDTGYRWDNAQGANVTEAAPPDSRAMTDGARAVLIAATSDDDSLALKSGFEEGFTQRLSGNATAGDDFCLFVADKAVTSAGDIISGPIVEQTVSVGDQFLCNGIFTLKPSGGTPTGPRLVHSQAAMKTGGGSPDYATTVPIDFDVKAGDLILLAVATRGTSVPTVTVSTAGYTQEAADTTNSPPGGFVFYKVAAGGESSVTFTDSLGNFGHIGAVQVWRGVDTSTPFDVTTEVNATTSTSETHTPPSITPTSDHCAVVSLAMIGDDTPNALMPTPQGFQACWVDGSLWTSAEAFDSGLFSADKYVATAAAITAPTFDINNGQLRNWVGVSMALRPIQGAAPSAPTNPAATAVSSSQITVSWDDVANETGYRVERSPDGLGSWVDVSGNLAADTVSWPNTGLTASTQYFYRIFAFNADGDSPASTTVNATTDASGGGNRMGGTGAIRKPPRNSMAQP